MKAFEEKLEDVVRMCKEKIIRYGYVEPFVILGYTNNSYDLFGIAHPIGRSLTMLKGIPRIKEVWLGLSDERSIRIYYSSIMETKLYGINYKRIQDYYTFSKMESLPPTDNISSQLKSLVHIVGVV